MPAPAPGARGERPPAILLTDARALVRAGPEAAYPRRVRRCVGGSRVTDSRAAHVCAGRARMHLYYHLGEDGKRVYTLKKKDPEGKVRLRASCAACERACVHACVRACVRACARALYAAAPSRACVRASERACMRARAHSIRCGA